MRKLVSGDFLWSGKDTEVVWADPIRSMIKIRDCDGEEQILPPWELFVERPEKEKPQKRRRISRHVELVEEPAAESDFSAERPPVTSPLVMNNNDTSEVEFFNFILDSGVHLQVGKFYKLAGSTSNYVLVKVARNDSRLVSTFYLSELSPDGIVTKIMDDFCVTVTSNYIDSCVYFKTACLSKVSSVISGLIEQAHLRIFNCPTSKSFEYLREVRIHNFGVNIRHTIRSNISRNGTRSTQPIYLGNFEPMFDVELFGLNPKNNFRRVFAPKDFGLLDKLMGKYWDIKPLVENDPASQFKIVNRLTVYVDKATRSRLKCTFTYVQSPLAISELPINYRGVAIAPLLE